MDLIPGLPDDVAIHCLLRTHYSHFSSISSVSQSWRNHIALPDFLRLRINSGTSQLLIVMAQAVLHPDTQPAHKTHLSYPPAYKLTLFEPHTGNWSNLPPPPDGIPIFCRLAGVGSDLVLMGGWHPKTFGVSRSVYVYSFITATWRRGADMPEPARSFFGCAADAEEGVVYVVGGHDEGKNALRSVVAHDVAKDEWKRIGDMAAERDECHAVVHCGKLHVIGGYYSDMQGRFEKSAEALDLKTKQWEETVTNFLDAATCHKACTNYKREMYTCREGHVAVQGADGKWKNVVEMPCEVGEVSYAAAWGDGKMLVLGTSKDDSWKNLGFILDMKRLRWVKVVSTEKCAGNIQYGCVLEI